MQNAVFKFFLYLALIGKYEYLTGYNFFLKAVMIKAEYDKISVKAKL